MGISIEAKQVNPAAAVLPVSELLVYYHQVGREHRDVGFEPPLKVFSLQQFFNGRMSSPQPFQWTSP